MSEKLIQNSYAGCRNDGVVSSYTCSGNAHCETWIHKKVSVSTGDGEDDFVIIEKAKKIDEYDIDKLIQENAKGADLKSLIEQVLRTGDESLLHQREGMSADVSAMPSDLFQTMDIIKAGKVARDNIPVGLVPAAKSFDDVKKNDDALINMSKEEIIKYYNSLLKSPEKTGEPTKEDIVNE